MVLHSDDERRRLDSTNVYTLHKLSPNLPSLLMTSSTSTVSDLTTGFDDRSDVSIAEFHWKHK